MNEIVSIIFLTNFYILHNVFFLREDFISGEG